MVLTAPSAGKGEKDNNQVFLHNLPLMLNCNTIKASHENTFFKTKINQINNV